jgi:hypothetical protein
MCDGEDRHVRLESDEDDVIRKVVDREASHIRVTDSRHDGTGPRELLEMMKRLPYFVCEPYSYFLAPIAIPIRRIAQLATCSRT